MPNGKHTRTHSKGHLNRNRLRLSVSLALLTLTTTFIISTNAMQVFPSQTISVYQTPAMHISKVPAPPPENPLKIYKHTIKKGETLSEIIQDFGLAHELDDILALDKKSLKKLAQFQANKTVSLAVNDNTLQELIYHHSLLERIILSRKENNIFKLETQRVKVERSVASVSATIEDSLYLAGKKAGISDKLIMQLANDILGWDVDFIYDIRSGAFFTLFYEELYLGGEKISDGNILALHFSNAGKQYNIVRFTDSKKNTSYYTLQGKNVRKAFLRSPLDFAYISSHFNPNRKHPILHVRRAHKGVDYAAKRGTPVRATGDGRVVMRGRKGGYGNTVIVRHGQKYRTLYAHLSRFAKKLRVGSYVRQGQTIGYVGSTGLSTGPHLHYEFQVNGVHKNPVTVKLPAAAPLPKPEMPRFVAQTRRFADQLHLISQAYK